MKIKRTVILLSPIFLILILFTSCFVRNSTYDAVVIENTQLKNEISEKKDQYQQVLSENEQLRTTLEGYMLDPARLYSELENAYMNDEFEVVKDRYRKLSDYHMNYDYFPIARNMYEEIITREKALIEKEKLESEQAKQKESVASESDRFVEKDLGRWEDPAFPADVTIRQIEENRFKLTYYFNDGSNYVEIDYIKEIKADKAKLVPVENDFGEYFLLNLNTNKMELYGTYGYDRTLNPIRKVSLEFLANTEY